MSIVAMVVGFCGIVGWGIGDAWHPLDLDPWTRRWYGLLLLVVSMVVFVVGLVWTQP